MHMLITDIKMKLQVLLQKIGKDSEKKGLPINYKKKESMVFRKKKMPRCQLRIRDSKS